MSSEREQILAGIAALEAQRELLGDAVVDASIAALRSKILDLTTGTAAEPAQTLRQVSILFLDVVGSTTLAQHLDPEDIHAVMDGALARCTAVVLTHHGQVLQYAGDSLLATFGADEVREDDAERAVRCGLALLAEGRALAAEVQAAHGHAGFDVRVGIHTGGVLLGGGVDAEGTIRGIAVNIAARMEQSAPAGGLRISHDTYRKVRGIFDVDAQAHLSIKGVDEPIATYLVFRVKPRAFRVTTRGIEGVETRTIGRDSELSQLQEAFGRLYNEGGMGAVIVVAEAGVGKSRLLYEFENWAEARPEVFTLFRGRAYPQTQGQPYGLLRDILARRLQVADDDSMATAKAKIEQGIAQLFLRDDGADMAQGHAHLLGHLIGLDFADSRHVKGIREDGKQIRARGFHAAAQMFRRINAGTERPILLLLEDLHWADDGSLDFLDYLAQVDRDVPMLLLGVARPELFERRAGGTVLPLERIDLLPLDESASRHLATELLKKLDAVPQALYELIVGRAQGNPFYMEELVKMLVDEGAIDSRGERWTLFPDKLLSTHVPQTLTGVLQARLDGLKQAEKLALQQASVIGFVFWDQALATIDARATDALPAVTRRAFVKSRPEASFDGVREFAFHHQILHHVTYDTVLKRLRREYHAKAANWLAGLSGARANDFLGLAAEHFEKAGDQANASEFFTRAAEHSAARFAHEAAQGYVMQALALMGVNMDASEHRDRLLRRWRLLDVRERTLDLQGRRTEQRADIAALQELADVLDDDRRRSELAWRESGVALRTGDFHTMESAARHALALAERAADSVLRLHALHRLAGALGFLGDAGAAKALAHRGLADARSLGLRAIESLFLSTLSAIANMQGDLALALELGQQMLPIDQALCDRPAEVSTVVNLGVAWLSLGDFVQARRDLEDGLRLARAIGHRAAEPYPLNSLSMLARWQGDDAVSLVHAQLALDIAVAVKDRSIEAVSWWSIGNAELALGRLGIAAAAFERALSIARAIDDSVQYDALAGLACVALAQADVPGAMQAVEGILAGSGSTDVMQGMSTQLIRLRCLDVLERVGDPRAAGILASAHGEFQAGLATLTDAAMRHRFLNNIPDHRAIVAAWEAGQASLPLQGRVVP